MRESNPETAPSFGHRAINLSNSIYKLKLPSIDISELVDDVSVSPEAIRMYVKFAGYEMLGRSLA